MIEPSHESQSPRPLPRRRRWPVRTIAAVIVLAGFVAWHPRLLSAVGGYLVLEQPCERPGYVLVLQGDHRYDRAAELSRGSTGCRIVLIDGYPQRVEEMGLLPTGATIGRRALIERGVPAEAIEVIHAPTATNDWQRMRAFGQWLDERPSAPVLVLCARSGGRHLRGIIDQILPASTAARVSVCCLSDRYFDESSWWRNKPGMKTFFASALQLVYDGVYGEPDDKLRTWDPAEYEKSLR
jgi:hypothetical protein